MTELTKAHLGYTAIGEEHMDMGFSQVTDNTDNHELSNDKIEVDRKTACTKLWWNGQYQKPNITITTGRIVVRLGKNVENIQLRHASSGGINYFNGGTHSIENGTYVLSLFGSTHPYEYIIACVDYD